MCVSASRIDTEINTHCIPGRIRRSGTRREAQRDRQRVLGCARRLGRRVGAAVLHVDAHLDAGAAGGEGVHRFGVGVARDDGAVVQRHEQGIRVAETKNLSASAEERKMR